MKFIDFFKKLLENEVETPILKISFNNIESLLEDKKRQYKTKEKEVLALMNNKIKEVVKNINEELKIIEHLDINEKKEQEKVKAIVKENLNNYIKYVKNFIEKIENLKQENLEEFIIKINKIFNDFDEKSYITYKKAAYLFGKELTNTKEGILEFSKYSKKLFDQNEDLINKSKIISSIQLKLSQINENNENINKINEIIAPLDKKIINNKELSNNILKDIKKIKKSKDYEEHLKKKQEIESIEKEIEKEIYDLKGMINLKGLANFFHNDEKEMNIIKAHKENFQTVFQKDNGSSILDLLDRAKLDNSIISDKINKINNKQEIIKNTSFKDETEVLLSKANKIKLEGEKLNNEKIEESKKYEKLKLNKEKIIDLIKLDLKKLNVIIE